MLSEADKCLILHVSLPINEYTRLMGSDVNDQFLLSNSIFTKATIIIFQLNIEHDEMEARRLFNQLQYNGHIEMQLKNLLGAIVWCFSQISSGIKWMVNCSLNYKQHIRYYQNNLF